MYNNKRTCTCHILVDNENCTTCGCVYYDKMSGVLNQDSCIEFWHVIPAVVMTCTLFHCILIFSLSHI